MSQLGCTCRRKHRCDRWRDGARHPCPCLQAGEPCSSACECGWRWPCINKPASGFFNPETPDVEDGDLQNEAEDEDNANDHTLSAYFEDTGYEEFQLQDGNGTESLNISLQELLLTSDTTATGARPASVAATTATVAGAVTSVTEVIDQMSKSNLKNCMKSLVSSIAGAFEFVQLWRPGGDPPPEDPDQPKSPDNEVPLWCYCGRCRAMPTAMEQVCCRRTHGLCTTIVEANILNTVVTDRNVLTVALRSRNDLFAVNDVLSHNNYRFAAYRQYVLWRWGHLGRYRRVVIPSCVEWFIRDRYPEADPSLYVGFMPSQQQQRGLL